MQPKLYRAPFHPDHTEDIIAFALANRLRPFHPPRQMCRFLGPLISRDSRVVDIRDGGRRVACAVLVDSMQNPANSAGLVILGFDRDAAAITVYDLLVNAAKAELPADKAGIEFDFCDDCPVDLTFFTDRGFQPAYTTFEMLRQNGVPRPVTLSEGYAWRPLTAVDVLEFHHVLTLVFAHSVETSIPPLEEIQANLPGLRIPCILLMHNDRIAGFLNVFVDADDGLSGEISTIGLLPAYRGRGLGRSLLDKAVEELSSRKVRNIKLTVAAGNETALGLYQRSGFDIRTRDLCLRYHASD